MKTFIHHNKAYNTPTFIFFLSLLLLVFSFIVSKAQEKEETRNFDDWTYETERDRSDCLLYRTARTRNADNEDFHIGYYYPGNIWKEKESGPILTFRFKRDCPKKNPPVVIQISGKTLSHQTECFEGVPGSSYTRTHLWNKIENRELIATLVAARQKGETEFLTSYDGTMATFSLKGINDTVDRMQMQKNRFLKTSLFPVLDCRL